MIEVMKRLFKSSLALFLSVLLLVMSTVVPAKANLIGDLSTVTDPSLKNALNETLDDSTVVEDVYTIDTTVTENTYWIEDLTGLEVFINLESLTIDSQTVIDLAPLAGMENLTTLNLGGGSVNLENPADQRILYYICDRSGSVTAANFDCSSNMDSWVPSFPEGSTLTDPWVVNDGDTYVSFYWEDVGVGSAFDVVGYRVFVSPNPNELGTEVEYVEAAGSNYIHFGLDAMGIYPMDPNLYVTIHAEMEDPNVYAVLKDQIALSLALSMAHDKDYIEVNEYDVVTISVYAENIRSLYDAYISLNFDSQLFQLQEVRKGTVYGEQDVYIEEPADPANSPLNVQLWGVNELVLSGTEPVELLQLDFKAISSPGTGYFELGPTSVMAGNESYLEYSPYFGSVSTTVETLTLISSIVLSDTSLYLDTLVQNNAQLDIIEILPETATYPKAITWSSTNENVVTVDQSGFVTVVGQGVASIEVSADFGTAFASVDVEVVVPIDSIDIVQEELFLQVDETQMLDYFILPIDANVVSLEWTTGDVNVVTVDQYGNVTAVGPGTTEVIVTVNGGAFDSVMVTVDDTQPIEPAIGNLYFRDEDHDPSEIGGKLRWSIPIENEGVAGYAIYLLDNNNEIVSKLELEEEIGLVSEYSIPNNTLISSEIRRIGVTAIMSDNSESEILGTVPVWDYPRYYMASTFLQDLDEDGNEIQGELKVKIHTNSDSTAGNEVQGFKVFFDSQNPDIDVIWSFNLQEGIDEYTLVLSENTVVPEGATRILTMAFNSNGERATSWEGLHIVDAVSGEMNTAPENLPVVANLNYYPEPHHGQLVWENVSVESDITHHVLYYLNAQGERIQRIGQMKAEGTHYNAKINYSDLPEHTMGIGIYTKNSSGESPVGAEVSIVDSFEPRNLWFYDSDQEGNRIGGTVNWLSAFIDLDIDHYGVYAINEAGERIMHFADVDYDPAKAGGEAYYGLNIPLGTEWDAGMTGIEIVSFSLDGELASKSSAVEDLYASHPPVLHKKLDNIVLTEGESVTIDLNDYITHANSDLLTYEFLETMVFSAELEAGQLQITALNAGTEQIRFQSLNEGNTAFRSASVTVTVQPAMQNFLIEAPIENQYIMDGTQLRISLENLFTQIPDDITVQVDEGYGILEAYILDGHLIIDAPKMYAFLDGDMDNYMKSSMITLNAVSAEGEGISTAFMANVTSSMMYRSMMLNLGIIQESGIPLNLQHVLALINQLQQGVEGQSTESFMDINMDGVYDRRDMEQWLQLVRRTPLVPQPR